MIKYYRIALKFKDKTVSNIIDLSKLEADLIQAKEEYNVKSENQILLLKPHPRRINLVVRMDSDFQLSSIFMYLEILITDMNWSQFSIKNEKSFELVYSKELSKEECFNYLYESNSEDNICIDKYTLNKWAQMDEFYRDEEGEEAEPFGRNYRHRNKPESMGKMIEKINNLVGQGELKKELLMWIETKERLKSGPIESSKDLKIPYSYIFTAAPGSGITSSLKLMSEIYYGLSIINRDDFEEEKSEFENGRPMFFGRSRESYLKGVTVEKYDRIRNIENTSDDDDRINVYIVDPNNLDYKKIVDKIESNYICKNIKLGSFSKEELLRIYDKGLMNYGITLSKAAEEEFLEYDTKDMTLRTISTLISRTLIENKITDVSLDKKILILEKINIQKLLDTNPRADEVVVKEQSGLDELNSLVGLEDIKKQVKEILSQIIINKRKQSEGLIDEDSSCTMHMNFYGNPGTGKTTVARIIGKILKEEGILKKGEFYEVGREDLVALYVGHTASKTASVMNKALDSVLFIDEAYSLNGHTEHDFGKEALDTIIRHMENNRNRSVIIFAGYNKEMEELFKMNPGLKSRVPFKIGFRDYDSEELIDIFQMLSINKYSYHEEVKKELIRFFDKAKRYYKEDFSNGRFVRNVYEKIVMKQSARLYSNNKMDKDSLMTISLDDVSQIYQDNEYKEIYNSEIKEKRVFGFATN